MTTLILGPNRERTQIYADELGIRTRGAAAPGYIASSARAMEGVLFEDIHIVGSFFDRPDWLDMLTVAHRGFLKSPIQGVWYIEGRRVDASYIAGLVDGARSSIRRDGVR